MQKVLVLFLWLVPIFVFAEDKISTQPTLEERFALLQAQRDFLQKLNQALQAQLSQIEAGNLVDQKATELATKYHCTSWNPDFTCVNSKIESVDTPVQGKPTKK